MKSSRLALLALAAAALLQLAHAYPRMPENVASHFGAGGRPNGFQSREGFAGLTASMIALTVATLGGLGALFRRLPSRWFNLPDRDYWLAPERREETLAFLTSQLEWFGAMNLLLLVFVVREVFAANLRTPPRLDSTNFAWILGAYFLYTAVWLYRFIQHFRRKAPPGP